MTGTQSLPNALIINPSEGIRERFKFGSKRIVLSAISNLYNKNFQGNHYSYYTREQDFHLLQYGQNREPVRGYDLFFVFASSYLGTGAHTVRSEVRAFLLGHNYVHPNPDEPVVDIIPAVSSRIRIPITAFSAYGVIESVQA
jgi:hypothetical protein